MASRAAHPFEHATTHLVGGVAPDQVDLIFADLTAVQQMLSAADPQTSNLCDLHTHTTSSISSSRDLPRSMLRTRQLPRQLCRRMTSRNRSPLSRRLWPRHRSRLSR